MQPNPADTTNFLMLQLIKIVAEGPNAVNDINGLSSSTGYSSSTVWMQTLAYASLAFSVLAAFGAVMGKQWLNSFKGSRGRGSLEERGLQRQKRLDGLEYWHLQTVLGAFLVLLQISLLLFGLSLSANMWTQQPTISSVIISTTALGILFYVATILISVLHPDSPFQTAGSTLVGAISRKISKAFSDSFFEAFFDALSDAFSDAFYNALPQVWLKRFNQFKSTSTPNICGRSSPIRWILETSTNPEVVEAAAAMVPLVQWSPKIDASAAYARLVDSLATCVDRPELFVTCGKAMAHLCVHTTVKQYRTYEKESTTWLSWGDRGHFIRDAFADAHLAHDQLKNPENEGDRLMLQANVCTALKTMVFHGLPDRFPSPHDMELIWNGDLRWRHANGHPLSCDEFDWLIDYLVDKVHDEADDETNSDHPFILSAIHGRVSFNNETICDALLALSGMHGLGSSTKRFPYVKALVRFMAPTRPSRVRYAALRVVSDAGEDLASIANGSISQGLDATLLDELSRALSPVILPGDIWDGLSSFVSRRNRCYLRLISALTKNDEWCKRLTRDSQVEWCISSSLYDTVLSSSLILDKVSLAEILLHVESIDASGTHICPNPVKEKRWTLVNRAWNTFHYSYYYSYYSDYKEGIEALPALVAVTRQNLPDLTRAKLADLASDVRRALQILKDTRGRLGQADIILLDAALPIVQGLYHELSSDAEH
jgi:hypothetical protein